MVGHPATISTARTNYRYEGLLGVIALARGDSKAASQHFNNADAGDVYTMFCTAEAMCINGDAAGAAALYKKVANRNLTAWRTL